MSTFDQQNNRNPLLDGLIDFSRLNQTNQEGDVLEMILRRMQQNQPQQPMQPTQQPQDDIPDDLPMDQTYTPDTPYQMGPQGDPNMLPKIEYNNSTPRLEMFRQQMQNVVPSMNMHMLNAIRGK